MIIIPILKTQYHIKSNWLQLVISLICINKSTYLWVSVYLNGTLRMEQGEMSLQVRVEDIWWSDKLKG